MKISFIIAALILGIASFFGMNRKTRIHKLKIENQDLVMQGQSLEISAKISESSSPVRAEQVARQQERETLIDNFLSELKSLLNGNYSGPIGE